MAEETETSTLPDVDPYAELKAYEESIFGADTQQVDVDDYLASTLRSDVQRLPQTDEEVEQQQIESGYMPLPGREMDLDPATPVEIEDYFFEVYDHIFQGQLNRGKTEQQAEKIASEQARSALIYNLVGEVPKPTDPDAKGILAAGGRVFGSRKLYGMRDADTPKKAFDMRMEENRNAELEIREMVQEEGAMAVLGKVWEGSEPMTIEEAKKSGIGIDRQSFWGRDRQDGVDDDVSFFDDAYIPFGIKNIPELIERAAIKINIPGMFANVFLDEDEREAYLKETKLALPTENFERIVETVELAHEKGLNDKQIEDQLGDEIGSTLMQQSFDDLPSGFQVAKPSVDLFKKSVNANNDRFTLSNNDQLRGAALLVQEGASDKVIQKALNDVSFGALPEEVWAGSVRSTVPLVRQSIETAKRVIEAKGDAGRAARVLEKGIESTLFSAEQVGDEIKVMENTLGKALRMLGVFTEGVAEIDGTFGLTEDAVKQKLKAVGLPEELSILPGLGVGNILNVTPASRDFYFNYGMRDMDSTWLSRTLANIETGNVGFTTHLTNEARKDGFERGTPEFHTKLFIGGALDFLVPWEKLHLAPVAHTTKAAARGASLTRKLNVSGYRGRAFLAGFSPAMYNRIYKTFERASLAADNIRRRLPDEIDAPALKSLLDQDDAFRAAQDVDVEVAVDDVATDFRPLTYTERKFADQIFDQMQAGKTFDDASEAIKDGYSPDVFETAADVTESAVRHVIETEEGIGLFPSGKPGTPEYRPGAIPFEVDQQTKRVLAAAGIRYEDIRDQLGKLAASNADEYTKNLRAFSAMGADEDTLELRNSKPYKKVRDQLDKLVEDGDMTPEEKVTLLAMMETRAHNTSGVETMYKKIKDPESYFEATTIERVATKLDDGSDGPPAFKIKTTLSKNAADEISMNSVKQLIDIFADEDTLSMTRLLDNDLELLVDLMGKRWTAEFIKNKIGNTKPREIQPNKMPSNTLNEAGKTIFERRLRTLIEGSGRLGADTVSMRELLANLTSVYARMGDGAKAAIIPSITKRANLNELLKPDRFFRPDIINRNVGRPNRPGTMVRVSGDLSARISEGRRAKTGRKRVFADVDAQPEYVKQALGITDDMQEVDAVDVYARAIGYVVAETMKKEEASKALRGMDLVNLTSATFVTREKAKSIRRSVNARLASVLGISNRSKISGITYLDAKKLKGIADAKSNTISLNETQQASFKVFIQRLASEPFVATRMPQELVGPGAKLDSISFENYNRVVELMQDVEAGAFARRTVYTEAISKSLAYSLLGAFRSGPIAKISGPIPPLNKFVTGVERMFKLDDPLSAVRPELKELLRRELTKLENVRSDVIKIARDARRQKPDATIEQIFDSLRNQLEGDMMMTPDQVEILLGNVELFTDKGEYIGKQGLLSIFNEFTTAEIARIDAEFAASEQAKGVDVAPQQLKPSQAEIIASEDVMTPDQFIEGLSSGKKLPSPIIEGESRLQYLTKSSTRALLQDLCSSGSFHGLPEEINTALTLLERYSTDEGLTAAAVAKLDDVERISIADSLFTIQEELERRAKYVRNRGQTILTAMSGETRDAAKNVDTVQLAHAYRLFHQGGKGWQQLYDFVQSQGADLGLDVDKIGKFSPAQAFLEMTVRLMAEDKLLGLYDVMVQHGMPGANVNYRMPKKIVSPTGAEVSIERSHAFYDRVRAYMDQIFKANDITEVVEATADAPERIRKPRVPTGSQDVKYRFAAFEEKGDEVTGNFHDLDAQLAAEEALVRFGVRTLTNGQELDTIVFPDGSVTYGPKGIKDEIDQALLRAASVGKAFGSEAAERLRVADVGAPFVPGEKTTTVKNYSRVANAITALAEIFPITFTNIKRGVTTGLFIPNPAYYTANFMGGALQLVTAVNPVKGFSMLTKNPKMVGAVVARMFGEGTHRPFGNKILVAKNGMIYNADQIADMAIAYRLNSSFIQAETQRSMAEDIKLYLKQNPTKLQKAKRFATAWNDQLAEVATALDNFYRVSIFVDGLNDGVSPGQAAGLARRAAFDYSALTDFEQRIMRNTIMFYSYMRKNMDLFFDALLTDPSRVTNQLRLTNGLHRANLDDESQVVLPEYIQARLGVATAKPIINKHVNSARMYVLPNTPIMDSMNLMIDTYDAVRGNADAARMLFSKVTPWYQAPAVFALGVDPFYGGEVDRYNKIPAWLMEWDLAVTGGQLGLLLEVERESNRNDRLRTSHDDSYRQFYNAKNGKLWWAYRNLLQIPGTGRSMSIITQVDQANLGIVEAITDMLRTARLEAEELGLADEKDREWEFIDGDTMSPKVGLTPLDHILGIGGVRTTLVPNVQFARERALKDLRREYRKRFPQSQDPFEQRAQQRQFDPGEF